MKAKVEQREKEKCKEKERKEIFETIEKKKKEKTKEEGQKEKKFLLISFFREEEKQKIAEMKAKVEQREKEAHQQQLLHQASKKHLHLHPEPVVPVDPSFEEVKKVPLASVQDERQQNLEGQREMLTKMIR